MINSYSQLDLKSRLLFCRPNNSFPLKPRLGQLVHKAGIIYGYLVINDTEQWFPLTNKIDSYYYQHPESAFSVTIEHELNTQSLIVIVYDSNGIPQEDGFEITVNNNDSITITFDKSFIFSVGIFKKETVDSFDQVISNHVETNTIRVGSDLFLKNECSTTDFSLKKMFQILGSMSKQLVQTNNKLLIDNEIFSWLYRFFNHPQLFLQNNDDFFVNPSFDLLLQDLSHNIVSSLLEGETKEEFRLELLENLRVLITLELLESFLETIQGYYDLNSRPEAIEFFTDLNLGDHELSPLLWDLNLDFDINNNQDEILFNFNIITISDLFTSSINNVFVEIKDIQHPYTQPYLSELNSLFLCGSSILNTPDEPVEPDTPQDLGDNVTIIWPRVIINEETPIESVEFKLVNAVDLDYPEEDYTVISGLTGTWTYKVERWSLGSDDIAFEGSVEGNSDSTIINTNGDVSEGAGFYGFISFTDSVTNQTYTVNVEEYGF